MFKKGDWVDVEGISKGKGFQGVIKRHHYRGGPETHGHMFHRAPGSIGSSAFPSRVWAGKTLPGHMGAERVTVHRLKVVDSRPAEHLLFVRGAIPGAENGLVVVRKSKKG
jgi:large subunit ribosomal protein L3